MRVISILDATACGFDMRFRIELVELCDAETRYQIEVFEYDEPVRIIRQTIDGKPFTEDTAREYFAECKAYYLVA